MTNQMITADKIAEDPSLAKLQAWVLANVGASKRRLGKLNEAVDAYQQSVAIHEKVSGARSAEMFDALHGLGHTYLEAGNPTKAEEYYTRAVNYLVANPDLIDQIYETANLEMIARLYRDVGKYAEAEPYFKRVLANRQVQGGELEVLKEIAQFYAMQNKDDQAETYLLRAIDLQEKALVRIAEERQLGLSELAEIYGNLGEVYSGRGLEQKAKYAFELAQEFQNAELSRRTVLSIQRSTSTNRQELSRRTKDNATHLERCADLLVKLERYATAEHMYLLAIAGRLSTSDRSAEGNEKLAMVFLKLGDLYRLHLNKHEEAVKRYRAAAETLAKSPTAASGGGGGQLYGEAYSQLGSLYASDMNQAAEGERVLKEALEVLSKSPNSEKATWRTLGALEGMYVRQSRFTDALEVSKQKLSVMHALLKRTSLNVTGVEKWNAEDYTEAFKLYVQSVSELADDYKGAGDLRNSEATYASLLVEELRVHEVIDPGVLASYAQMLSDHRQALPAETNAAADRRVHDLNVRRKVIQAVLDSAD
jgi:tetratricopeptide (TPR) repeat protein